jgi:hypothetical protein
MNWIRLATTMKGDTSVHQLAHRLTKGDVPKVIGHLQCLLSELPAHARDGDLRAIPDSLLEQWAMWGGKRGAFADAFRTIMCSDRTVVRAWDKHNGAAIREADRNRRNVAAYRERKRNDDDDPTGGTPARHPVRTGPVSGDASAYPIVNGTGRDGNSSSTALEESARALFLHSTPRGSAA